MCYIEYIHLYLVYDLPNTKAPFLMLGYIFGFKSFENLSKFLQMFLRFLNYSIYNKRNATAYVFCDDR